MHYDIIIVGGGIIGCATALTLLTRDPTLKIAILEKEKKIAQHQTGHNSGVIHAGVYYKPGSLKAKLCRLGCQATKNFCETHRIPYRVLGKLIAASNEKELQWMEALVERCQQNQLAVIRLSGEEALKYQPGLRSIAALLIEESGIVNWVQVCEKYAELAEKLGAHILCDHTVIAIEETAHDVKIKTQRQSFESAYLITCGGLHSDHLVALSGQKPQLRIVPFRGEYYQLSSRFNHYFKHLVYPVPNPNMPFLGVHFTPQISGINTVGPNAILAFAREGYRWRTIKLKEMWNSLTYLPLWKMMRQHSRAICYEIAGSISKNYYLKECQKYFPEITKNDLKIYPAGVRAQAIDSSGKLVDDFLFSETDRILHTCNAPSPAATSSIPIGQYIADKFLGSVIYKPSRFAS